MDTYGGVRKTANQRARDDCFPKGIVDMRHHAAGAGTPLRSCGGEHRAGLQDRCWMRHGHDDSSHCMGSFARDETYC